MGEYRKYDFGPLLMKTNVDLNLCKELLEVGKNQIIDGVPLVSSTFDSAYEYTIDKQNIFKDQITPYITGYLNEVSKLRNLKPYDFKYDLDSLWINFQKAKDYSAPHFHACDISFVIYVSIPEEIIKESMKPRTLKNGSITFSYGQNLNRRAKYDSFIDIVNTYTSPTTQVSHMPNVGDMFIFPSYLQHHVLQFFSEGVERVSVAGNVWLINNEKKIL